ncbi:MAG: hypothetical protein KAW88_00010 [Candidatus Cloacimonetes bacterium]|nr:hypothetical protein [Candidatus Cloacimonadota bacterium]
MKQIVIAIIISLFIISSLIAGDFEEYKKLEEQEFKGSKIFDKMVQAIGDVTQIKNIRTKGITIQPIPQGTLSFPVEVVAVFPDKFKVKFQDKEFIINRDRGWMRYAKGYYENLPESYVKIVVGNLNRNLIKLAKSNNDYEILFLGDKEILGKQCYELLLRDDILEFKLYISKEKKLPLQMIYEINNIIIERTFLEYKEIEGIMYPIHTVSFDENAEKISEIIINEIELNIELDEDEF